MSDTLATVMAETLGPVINRFLHRLDTRLTAVAGPDTRVLMALRAGLRIEALYRLWRETRGMPTFTGRVLLRSSRMLTIKAAYAAQPGLALDTLWRELEGAPLEAALRAILLTEGGTDAADIGPVPDLSLAEFLEGDHPLARRVHAHLATQSERYGRYLDRLAGGASRLIFVDSGWKGTTQMLLEAAYPQYAWDGVYFGAIGRSALRGRRPGAVHGLMFDGTRYDPDRPETAFLAHRHLIESLFEPGIETIEALSEGDIEEPLSVDLLSAAEQPGPWDDAYRGVADYIRAHASDPPARMVADSDAALERLARILLYPTADEVPLFAGKPRSFDLGRDGAATSVMPAEERGDWDSPERRIAQAIWQPGQAALEYQGRAARRRQEEMVTTMTDAPQTEYFAARRRAPDPDLGTHVAVITRTKDRPLLLERAAASVAAQTHADLSWVVVNDGGDPDAVDAVIAASDVDPTRVTVCHNPESLGMEAASNTGIAAVGSDFIAIHDDDDSWEPGFLARTVDFLIVNQGVYKGVITGTTHVSEEIAGDKVIEHGRKPYQNWVRNVQLTEMAVGNFFAPIAFLFRRDVYDHIGGFDEDLPVLGDWDFNLRFLMEADIGVIPDPLANYHHRDQGDGGGASYSNSVIGGVGRHAAYTALVRNKYFRMARDNPGYAALAGALGAGLLQQDTRTRIARGQAAGPQAGADRAPAEAAPAGKLQDGYRAAVWLLRHLAASEGSTAHLRARLDAMDLSAALSGEELAALSTELLALQKQIGGPVAAAAATGEPVSWLSGAFRDNWIALESELAVYDAEAVELAVFLPKAEGAADKPLIVYEDGEILTEVTLARGKQTNLRLTPRGSGRVRVLRFVGASPEAGRTGDVRLLGFQCIRVGSAGA